MRIAKQEDLGALHKRGPGAHWCTYSFENTEIHLIPNEDLLIHVREECVCFPDIEEVQVGKFVYTHHAWDGRD